MIFCPAFKSLRRLGIGEGQWVIIETPRCKINKKAKLTSKIPRKVIEAQHGWWFPEEIPEDPILFRAFDSNANMLTTNRDEYCDLPTGALNVIPYLCKVYPAKRYY